MAVAVEALSSGVSIAIGGVNVALRQDIPEGHKFALRRLDKEDVVIKYGHELGRLTGAVEAGDWIHTHNLRTALEPGARYVYEPTPHIGKQPVRTESAPTFMGYRRRDGRVGTRNEIWIVNTVGCVNRSAERIAAMANQLFAGRVDGVHAFAHPYGCSQLGDDLTNTQRILASLIRHPNAGGVLVLGLGCENNRMETLLEMAGDVDRERIRYFSSQLVLDEVEEGLEAVEELVRVMENDRREACPASDLVIGMKCGGSDGFSGITANPLVGRITDRLTDMGGTALL
ncbi:MAG: UxaA family hydrolase, partial [Bacteroidota bacterium]